MNTTSENDSTVGDALHHIRDSRKVLATSGLTKVRTDHDSVRGSLTMRHVPAHCPELSSMLPCAVHGYAACCNRYTRQALP